MEGMLPIPPDDPYDHWLGPLYRKFDERVHRVQQRVDEQAKRDEAERQYQEAYGREALKRLLGILQGERPTRDPIVVPPGMFTLRK
jgi:hypothetical protein